VQVIVIKGGKCDFFFSENGKNYLQIDTEFTTREGKWIGAKIGLLALRNEITNDAESIDIDWIRINKYIIE